MPVAVAPANPVDLDLDLDFSIGDDAPAPAAAVSGSAPQPTLAMQLPPAAEAMPTLDMDFGATAKMEPLAAPDLPATPGSEPARPAAPAPNVPGNALSFAATQPVKTPAPVAAPAQAPVADAGMIEFDLGALSLDLDSPPAAGSSVSPPQAAKPEPDQGPVSTAGAPLSTGGLEDSGNDPLATKLALAQEFNAIGDPDGARSLAEEVLAEASGDLKQKAQRFLAEIA
jgi:pilus assembly protein FimV